MCGRAGKKYSPGETSCLPGRPPIASTVVFAAFATAARRCAASSRYTTVPVGASISSPERVSVARGLAEKPVVERVDPLELFDRPLVIVDAQVCDDVGELRVAAVALDHEERGGLLAATVASGALRRGEALDQPPLERQVRGRLE